MYLEKIYKKSKKRAHGWLAQIKRATIGWGNELIERRIFNYLVEALAAEVTGPQRRRATREADERQDAEE